MSRRITLSTFSSVPPAVSAQTSPDQAVQQVLEFWQRQLGNVLPDRPDLILLPEVADMPPVHGEQLDAYLEASGTRVRDFLASAAREHQCHIAYSSLRTDESGARRNSMVVLDRQGRPAGYYDKRHITLDEYNNQGLRYGDGEAIIDCDFGRLACVICFDLNFDDARQRIASARPDLILFSSMYHGGLMQAYWAYSCRAHFVAAVHHKPSAILLPTGEIIAGTTNYFDYVTAQINLDCGLFHLDCNRPKLEAARAKYGRKLSLRDPGFIGSVLLSCEDDELTLGRIISEFELEPLDDYFKRALDHRQASCLAQEKGRPVKVAP